MHKAMMGELRVSSAVWPSLATVYLTLLGLAVLRMFMDWKPIQAISNGSEYAYYVCHSQSLCGVWT